MQDWLSSVKGLHKDTFLFIFIFSKVGTPSGVNLFDHLLGSIFQSSIFTHYIIQFFKLLQILVDLCGQLSCTASNTCPFWLVGTPSSCIPWSVPVVWFWLNLHIDLFWQSSRCAPDTSITKLCLYFPLNKKARKKYWIGKMETTLPAAWSEGNSSAKGPLSGNVANIFFSFSLNFLSK